MFSGQLSRMDICPRVNTCLPRNMFNGFEYISITCSMALNISQSPSLLEL